MQTVTKSDDLLQAAQAELNSVSAELSRLTGIDAPSLHSAETNVDAPPLFVYGILGGKDVGKTTLINALARGRISYEPRGIGPGTNIPVIYVHRDDSPVLRERLAADPGLEFQLVTHDREILRHVALVDLPDFDSKRNLPDHARRAAEFKPHLDAFIWVTTVRKIDHPELLRQMDSVAPKKDNFICVVSFADEVIRTGKDSLEGLRQVCLEKLQKLYFTDYEAENLFAVCMLDADAYDFPALERQLIRQHSPDEITQRRRSNAIRATIANLIRVREHYRIDESIDSIRRLLGELPERFAENLSPGYWEAVTARLGQLDGPYRRMAARLFSHRIWGWPILSALLFPLSSIVSFLGGRLFFESGNRWTDYHQLRDMLTVDGLGLEVRLRRVASEHRAKFLRLHQTFGELLSFEFDPQLEMSRWETWLDENDRATLERLQQQYRRPGIFKRWLVYLPVLWFPIVQPVAERLLNEPELTSGRVAYNLGVTVVSLLSASYLLRSAAVLVLVYLLWLLWFYSSSARRVARQRLNSFASLRTVTLEPSLLDQLQAPYEHLAHTLQELADRLARQREQLESALPERL